MTVFLGVTATLLLAALIPELIIWQVKRARKKPTGTIKIAALVSLVLGLGLFAAYFMTACYHDSWTHTGTIAPTCTEEGWSTRICDDCGYESKYDKQPALGHDLQEASRTDTQITRRCTRCGQEETEAIEPPPQPPAAPAETAPPATDPPAAEQPAEPPTAPAETTPPAQPEQTDPEPPPADPEPQPEPQPEPEPDTELDTSLITAYYNMGLIHDGKQLVKVIIKNGSSQIFSGSVHCYFYNTHRKSLGWDTIYVEDQMPGSESWAPIYIDPADTIDFEYTFSDVRYTELPETTAEIDTAATEATKNSYRLSFEGTSWYNDILDIQVYTDGTCTITIADDPKQDYISYAAVIRYLYNDYSITQVTAVDSVGNILAVKP